MRDWVNGVQGKFIPPPGRFRTLSWWSPFLLHSGATWTAFSQTSGSQWEVVENGTLDVMSIDGILAGNIVILDESETSGIGEPPSFESLQRKSFTFVGFYTSRRGASSATAAFTASTSGCVEIKEKPRWRWRILRLFIPSREGCRGSNMGAAGTPPHLHSHLWHHLSTMTKMLVRRRPDH